MSPLAVCTDQLNAICHLTILGKEMLAQSPNSLNNFLPLAEFYGFGFSRLDQLLNQFFDVPQTALRSSRL